MDPTMEQKKYSTVFVSKNPIDNIEIYNEVHIAAWTVFLANEKAKTVKHNRIRRNSPRIRMDPIWNRSLQKVAWCISDMPATVEYATTEKTTNHRYIAIRKHATSPTRSCQLSTKSMSSYRKHWIKGCVPSPVGLPTTMMKSPEVSPSGPSIFRSRWNCKFSIRLTQFQLLVFFHPLSWHVIWTLYTKELPYGCYTSFVKRPTKRLHFTKI